MSNVVETDPLHPARHVLLVVSTTDGQSGKLDYLSGPVVPPWAGVGDGPTDYGGQPGKAYAKVLEELWTEVFPSTAYWRQTVIREDTRLPARATDVSSYEFRAPEAGSVAVEAKLVFRRAFKELAAVKKWGLPDIETERQSLTLP